MGTAFAGLLGVAAVLAWVNERYVKVPTTVGVTLAGAATAVLLSILGSLGILSGVKTTTADLLQTLDFTTFVLNGILSILLFAGAMSLDARELLRQRAGILTLAGVSTLVSTALIGGAAYLIFGVLGIGMPLVWAMLFGALISPTDPVAVLDLLKRAKVPRKLETLIAGESLLNDGVGVVLFVILAGLAGADSSHHVDPTALGVLGVFVQEAIGGLAFGLVLGWIAYRMCRSIDGHVVEILITLAMVVCGYVLATSLGLSGPLAMVAAGSVMSAGKEEAFDPVTRDEVLAFWDTLDKVLNILLFAFIGLDVILTETHGMQIVAGLLLVGIALGARLVSVWLPITLLRHREGYPPGTIRLLTWGGLRGGIAISLALALPPSDYRSSIVTATYAVVLFTIAVQGLTVMPLVRRFSAHHRGEEQSADART